ncbi:Uncharacterised protein [Escherichia coli]|uniref:Uncharacterized protein n=1 Tax=Escherichia coli TaxID=562 RepID=A0A376MMS1_ECOLX|nr:Uncharacterised protein [Escherichia coli]
MRNIGAVFWRDFVNFYISAPSVTLSHGDNFLMCVLKTDNISMMYENKR